MRFFVDASCEYTHGHLRPEISVGTSRCPLTNLILATLTHGSGPMVNVIYVMINLIPYWGSDGERIVVILCTVDHPVRSLT